MPLTDVNVSRPPMSEIEPTATAEDSSAAPLYKVMLLNDDETPMEFVVEVLETVFGKSRDDAIKIMLRTHEDGVGVCGVYGEEQAKSLVGRVRAEAHSFQHPLQCVMERG
jgi:ATP-dependent Clp protease adaptor protein ClpS